MSTGNKQKFKYKGKKEQVHINTKFTFLRPSMISTIVFIFKYLVVQFDAICDINGTPVFRQLLNTNIQPVQ